MCNLETYLQETIRLKVLFSKTEIFQIHRWYRYSWLSPICLSLDEQSYLIFVWWEVAYAQWNSRAVPQAGPNIFVTNIFVTKSFLQPISLSKDS